MDEAVTTDWQGFGVDKYSHSACSMMIEDEEIVWGKSTREWKVMFVYACVHIVSYLSNVLTSDI